MGHEVTLYATADSQRTARLIAFAEQGLWRTDDPPDVNQYHFAQLSHAVREGDAYDIIHSHLDYVAFPFDRASTTPFVHTMHGRLDLPESAVLFREFPDVPLVSISDSQRDPIPHANWVRTVHNGMALAGVPVGKGHGGYLVFLGRISPEKGVAEAIDVALQAEIPLKIAARMPLENVSNPSVRLDWEYYRDQVKPRLGSSLIEFVGEVSDVEKWDLLEDAGALIFPLSWPEPFGLAVIEAMACGTPVISRPLGAIPEIVRDGRTGFLRHTIDEMVAACREIHTLDRTVCRADVEDRFSARAMALGYLDAYQRVIERAGGEWSAQPIHLISPPRSTQSLPA